MLQEQKLKDGLKEAVQPNRDAFKQLEEKIQKLQSDIGQSLTHEQFQEMAANMRENKTKNMEEETAKRMGEALADYLNDMEDMTGDNPLKPFTVSQTKPIFDALMQIGEQGIPPVDAKIQQIWTSFFPIQFSLKTPPSGSVQKTSSVGSIVPLQSIAPPVTTDKQFDDFVEEFAQVIHMSASKIPVVINHMVSSPSGPVPGPPISGIVK